MMLYDCCLIFLRSTRPFGTRKSITIRLPTLWNWMRTVYCSQPNSLFRQHPLGNWISRSPSRGLFGQVPLFLSKPNIALEQRTVSFLMPYFSVWTLQAVNYLEAQHGEAEVFWQHHQSGFLWWTIPNLFDVLSARQYREYQICGSFPKGQMD